MNTGRPITREIAPRSHQAWVRSNEDERTQLEARLVQWLDYLAQLEALFKKHVYENPEMSDLDLRQHRAMLHNAVSIGEMLAVDYIGAEIDHGSVAFIDQKLEQLRTTLHQWHAPLELQTDIPESFKQAVRDEREGRFVDMETALTQPPPQ